ncbi:uncharacterized protein LOC113659134 isoform X4, partial [Tachysurus ichikawai]
MILTSAERNDSGTYTLNIFDGDGRSKGSSTLQVNIEAQVSSVKVTYSCLSPGVMKVFYLILLILSSVCLILIVLAVLVFCVYKRRQGQRIKAPSQDSMQLVYAEVTHSARNRTDTRPKTSPVQYEGVEYGTVVTSNQKKKEDDVQYGELVFNTPAQKKCKVPKVQEDCVYSGVQRS